MSNGLPHIFEHVHLHEAHPGVSHMKFIIKPSDVVICGGQAWIGALRNLFLTVKCVKLIKKPPFTIEKEKTTRGSDFI